MATYSQRIIITFVISLHSMIIISQKITHIIGEVIDAQTKEPLSFVDIAYINLNKGTTTDLDGKFELKTKYPSDSILVTFLGYKTQYFKITRGIKNRFSIKLENEQLVLKEVIVKAKKQKYSKKNNPALDLIKKVIRNKKDNSLKGQDFYSYKQQEKLSLNITNISDDLRSNKLLNKIDFVWDFLDTSKLNGELFLPVFLRENLSQIYFKKKGNIFKEIRIATHFDKVDGGMDPQSVNDILDAFYQDIDI